MPQRYFFEMNNKQTAGIFLKVLLRFFTEFRKTNPDTVSEPTFWHLYYLSVNSPF